jgi:hypothetical protein
VKYLCDRCSRLVDLGRFTVGQGGALVLTCPTCGAESVVEPPKTAVPEPDSPRAPAEPEMATPPAAAPGASPAPSEALPADVEAQWSGLLARWQDANAHAQFVAFAGARGVLAEVGRRYRVRADAGDAMALKGRDEVIRKAIQLAQLASPVEERASRGASVTLVMAAGLFVVLVVLIALTFKILR